MQWWEILLAMGVPSAVMSILSKVILSKFDASQKAIEKRAADEKAEQEQKEKKHKEELAAKEARTQEFILMMLEANRSAIVLAEATARAVQRIPDAKCNGDMHAALEHVRAQQEKEKNFLLNLGVRSLANDMTHTEEN